MENLIDTWYGWIVVVASAFIAGTEAGLFKSAGQIYISMLESTPFSRFQVATACVIPRAVSAIFGIVGNKLCEKFSYRITFIFGILLMTTGLALSSLLTHNLILFNITYGVITGVGCGLSMSPALIVSGLYFKKYRSLAIGVNSALTTSHTIYTPILIQFLLDNYNLDGTLLLWGGIFLHGCIAAMLIRQPVWALKKSSKSTPVPETQQFLELEYKEDVVISRNKKKCFNFKIFKVVINEFSLLKRFTTHLLLLHRIVIFSGMVWVFLILPPFAIEQGENITKSDIAFFLSISSVGDVVSRIASGIVVNIFPKWKKTFYFTILILLASINFIFQYSYNYGALLTCSLFYGLILGCAATSYFMVIFDYFSVSEVPTVNALHYTLNGFVTLCLGPLTAALRNYTGSYTICWTVVSATTLLTAFVSIIHVKCVKK